MGRTSGRARTAEPPRKIDLAAALFAGTQQKVLYLLFGSPERSYFASELIELADSGSGAVQRELSRLVESGLVTQRLIGRQRHYQANAESPIFDELRGIVAKTAGIPESLRTALAPLADRAVLALLYGSVAKGEANSASDIDVLVVGDGILLEELYSAFESPEKALRRKINPTLYSLKEFTRRRKNRNPFLSKVLGGKTIPLLGDLSAVKGAR